MDKNTGLKIAVCAVLAIALTAVPGSGKGGKNMTLQELREAVDGSGSLVVTFEGDESDSYFSGKKYLHYESVAFFGEPGTGPSHSILYHTDSELVIICGAHRAAETYRRIRTRLRPSFEKEYLPGSDGPGMEPDGAVKGIFAMEGVKKVVLKEFGLVRGMEYFARFKTESYHLPPGGPGKKPARRENLVLEVSDSRIPNDTDLTPLYKGWSY
ncbi:MAG: hypothetical protein MUD12_07400 [Spirochaetes bacterium]|jgi:hypothetical protein|nr:hypothetical protein [Spirochaetota bacterium]